jgi:tRNA(Ile)-lysidine synthase
MQGAPGDAVSSVREAVRAGGLLASGEPLIVLLSGGRDSVCLLDVALALQPPQTVTALHLNYGLRDSADADERHCALLCEHLGVALRVVRAGRASAAQSTGSRETGAGEGTPPAGRQEGGNVQAWAREERYRAACELASELDPAGRGERTRELNPAGRAPVASGHTASDQVETILYRLAASPGRRALLGMAPSDRTRFGQRLLRPLLGITRELTTAYCRQRELGWCEDESNLDPAYARARVRGDLVPALRAVHPAAESNVLRTAALLREEAAVLEELVQEELDGARRVALERLGAMPAALARLVVVRLAEEAAGTYVPQAGDRVDELLALARRGGRAELHLGGGAGALIESGYLRVVKLPPRTSRHGERESN